MRKISLLMLCCCFLLSASAQYNNNVNKFWAFGSGASLHFIVTPYGGTSSMNASEGCASVCNAAGSLLFYTDGNTVYNRLGLVMPNGSAIVPFATGSSTQGALIVPFINDPFKYYLFSLEQAAPTPTSGQLAYAVIDMTLNGGLGDVVSTSSGIMIDTGMGEKMIAIPGNDCNIWVLTHKRDSAVFYAYEITSSGINTTPVVSHEGSFTGPYSNALGMMKCSPDRQKIVSVSRHHISTDWGIELFDFNPSTSIVSNCRVLDSNPDSSYYGVEFSPDNTKLYATNDSVYQWNLSLPTTAAIIASKARIYYGRVAPGDMKLGPDGKIYACHNGTGLASTSVSRINIPNAAGAVCGYDAMAVSIDPAFCAYGLPNLVWNSTAIAGAGTVCTGATTTFTSSLGTGSWISTDPSVATISSAGVITGITPGTTIISFSTGGCNAAKMVTVNPLPEIIGPTTICAGNSVGLNADNPGGTWFTASANATIHWATGLLTAISSGLVNITYTAPNGCTRVITDTVKECSTAVDRLNTTSHITLYPNPTTNGITITAAQPAFTAFTIYNAVGQVISTQEITAPEIKVNVKAYPPGQYHVIFEGDEAREMVRFIKW